MRLRTISIGSPCSRAHASLRAFGVSSTYTDMAFAVAFAVALAISAAGSGTDAGSAAAAGAAGSAGPSIMGPLYMNSRRSVLLSGAGKMRQQSQRSERAPRRAALVV